MTMKYILAFLLMLSVPCLAQVPMTGAGKSTGGVPPPTYTGPGDIVASASGFWSCSRAYSAAYASGLGNACLIADVATGAITCTMKFAANGFADLTSNLCAGGTQTVPAFCTANTSCVVSRAYDQVGTSVCTTACDAIAPSLARSPALTFSCIGTIPCITANANSGGNSQILQTPAWTSPSTIAQPCSQIAVGQRSSGTAQDGLLTNSANADGIYFSGTAQEVFIYAGGTTTGISASTGSPHAIQGAYNNTSSLINVDSSGATTVSPGTDGCIGGSVIWGPPSVATEVLVLFEGGLWPIALNSTQIGQINTNQHTDYGF